MLKKIKNVRVLKILLVMLVLLASLYGCSSGANNTGSKNESAYNENYDSSMTNEAVDENNDEEQDDKKETQTPKPTSEATKEATATKKASKESDNSSIPKYAGKAYVVLNNNKPTFSSSELKNKSYEHYGKLDSLGRCTVAKACIGKDIMPKGKRGAIGSVKPTGWHTVKYDIVDGKYLYNRCHLIGYQLTGENANERNLITGTRYLNVDGMLPFEDMVADYVKETGNHVLYKVTPVYKGKNLVASGVKMEAKSVEDKGKGICFNVYVYNVQPGVTIDYATGESKLSSGGTSTTKEQSTSKKTSTSKKSSSSKASTKKTTYILNVNTKKYHIPGCKSVARMKASNKKKFVGTAKELENKGYTACKNCH